MNFDQRVGEATLNTPGQEKQGTKAATENKQPVPENKIVSTSKDENFPGSMIIKTQDNNGTIKGYAIRTKEDGTPEGNEISYQPDGSIGVVQKLSEADLTKLQEHGVIGEYEKVKKFETTQKQDNARIWLSRLSLQGGDPFINQQETPEEKMYMTEATKALQNLNSAEQASLADMIFEDKIGDSPSSDSVRQLYGIYVKLKGTTFADRIRELEDKRLKDAGQSGFKL